MEKVVYFSYTLMAHQVAQGGGIGQERACIIDALAVIGEGKIVSFHVITLVCRDDRLAAFVANFAIKFFAADHHTLMHSL